MICTALLAAILAQPIPAAPDEGPAQVLARVRFERAVREELDGHLEDAAREGQACLDADPQGRFAEAARELILRVHGKPVEPIRSTGVGPRVELVITSTFTGLYLASLLAYAANADAKGTVALLMLGTGGALAGSIFGTSGRRVPQSMPQMLQNGVSFGTYATLLALAIGDARGNIGGQLFAGAAAGTLGGLIASPSLTGGDSAAIAAGMIYGAAVPVLLEATFGPHRGSKVPLWTALIGSSVGIIAGPILNRRVHYSRGRWNLITLGGGVGALFGAGIGVLTDAFNGEARGGLGLLTVGTVAGLGLTAYLTSEFGADEPHPGAAGLLHYENGKLSAGDPLAALAPARNGAYLRVLEGFF
jgi:hypothetical protein